MKCLQLEASSEKSVHVSEQSAVCWDFSEPWSLLRGMQQNLPNYFQEAGLVFFLHPDEFQVSSPQLSRRAAAAGGQVNGLGCLLGPDSGMLCPLQRSQLGEDYRNGHRPSSGSELDRVPKSREHFFLLEHSVVENPYANRKYSLSRQLARRGHMPCWRLRSGLSPSASLDFFCWPLCPVLSVTASAAF